MTEGKKETKKQVALPEAGGVAWVDLHGSKVEDGIKYDVKISLTHRAATSAEALQGLMESLAFAKAEYKLRPYQLRQKQEQKHAAVPAQVPAPAATAPPVPDAVNDSEPQYVPVEAQGEPTTGTMAIIKMEIAPRADGKTDLKFFMAGRQYPEIYACMTPEQLVPMLANTGAWTADHFKSPANYDVNYVINWRNSQNTNKNGKPYKDIVTVALGQG